MHGGALAPLWKLQVDVGMLHIPKQISHILCEKLFLHPLENRKLFMHPPGKCSAGAHVYNSWDRRTVGLPLEKQMFKIDSCFSEGITTVVICDVMLMIRYKGVSVLQIHWQVFYKFIHNNCISFTKWVWLQVGVAVFFGCLQKHFTFSSFEVAHQGIPIP